MAHANRNVAIVIPIYKAVITEYEKISLRQCSKIFKGYDILFAKPRSLDDNYYRQIIKDSIFIDFDDHFFSSIAGYNKLMISPGFYRKIYKYQYALIYQLDAFVFKKEIDSWCAMGIDYIGAPWINHPPVDNFRKSLLDSEYPFIRRVKKIIDFKKTSPPWVGNGGLSLRRVSTFYWISIFISPFISMLGYQDWNEDMIWSFFVPKYIPFFKVATFDQAVQFSIENSPSVAISYLRTSTPFGIHGWYANQEQLAFWRPFIENEGYLLPNDQI